MTRTLLLELSGMRRWSLFSRLPDAISFTALFLLTVFVLGLLLGFALMSWRARQDRREREGRDQIPLRR